MEQRRGGRPVATRIGSAVDGLEPVRRFVGGRAWTLTLLPLLLVPPVLVALLSGDGAAAGVGAASIAAMLAAAGLVQRGRRAQAEYEARAVARAPRPPLKLLGSALFAGACFAFANWGSGAGIFGLGQDSQVGTSLVLGLLAFAGCWLAYGFDPTRDKGIAEEVAARTGVRTEQVVATIAEAEGKLAEIERAAAALHSVELKTRLRRIVDQGRVVLRQLEREPRELPRARRFLVTYLDGTRDVVSKYAEQQHSLGDTPLGENFRRVLTTVEQVFLEQEEVLRRNEALDLDVQIEVLETQLKREGVA
ncbi:MAG: 5-bromo-4-chloroindolyl phosphate hydrolysis family protein [Geminicoccaceae bacterium]